MWLKGMPMVCFEKISTSISNFEGNSTLPFFYCLKLNFTSQWCFPISRWWINDQFQCINVFLYTTVFVFIMDFLLLSSPSVWIKWHMTKTFSNPQQIQKQDKTHLQRLANNLNSITLLPLSLAHLFKEKIFDSSQYSRPVSGKSNSRKLPNIFPVADILPDFIWQR